MKHLPVVGSTVVTDLKSYVTPDINAIPSDAKSLVIYSGQYGDIFMGSNASPDDLQATKYLQIFSDTINSHPLSKNYQGALGAQAKGFVSAGNNISMMTKTGDGKSDITCYANTNMLTNEPTTTAVTYTDGTVTSAWHRVNQTQTDNPNGA